MTKAEEKALEAYSELLSGNIFGPLPVDLNKACREKYQEGYEQAEKDLELTWEDIKKISKVIDIMIDDDIKGEIPEEWSDEEYYKEVLRRFNKTKNE